MNPTVEAFVNELYEGVKADFPDVSEFQVKSIILDKLREKATEYANDLIEVAETIELVKIVKQLVDLQV